MYAGKILQTKEKKSTTYLLLPILFISIFSSLVLSSCSLGLNGNHHFEKPNHVPLAVVNAIHGTNVAVAGRFLFATGAVGEVTSISSVVENYQNATASQNNFVQNEAEQHTNQPNSFEELGMIDLHSGLMFSSAFWIGEFDASGSVGSWRSGPDLPVAINNPNILVNGRYVYVSGGSIIGSIGPVPNSKVYFAYIQDDGSIGFHQNSTWIEARNVIPGGNTFLDSFVIGNRFAVLSGDVGGQRVLYHARIFSGGHLGIWHKSLNPLPLEITHPMVVASEQGVVGRVVLMNQNPTDSYRSENIYVARKGSQGVIGEWNFAGVMPEPLRYIRLANSGSGIFLSGITQNNMFQVWYSRFANDSDSSSFLQPWERVFSEPAHHQGDYVLLVANGGVYFPRSLVSASGVSTPVSEDRASADPESSPGMPEGQVSDNSGFYRKSLDWLAADHIVPFPSGGEVKRNTLVHLSFNPNDTVYFTSGTVDNPPADPGPGDRVYNTIANDFRALLNSPLKIDADRVLKFRAFPNDQGAQGSREPSEVVEVHLSSSSIPMFISIKERITVRQAGRVSKGSGTLNEPSDSNWYEVVFPARGRYAIEVEVVPSFEQNGQVGSVVFSVIEDPGTPSAVLNEQEEHIRNILVGADGSFGTTVSLPMGIIHFQLQQGNEYMPGSDSQQVSYRFSIRHIP